jgi:hypothetical protein
MLEIIVLRIGCVQTSCRGWNKKILFLKNKFIKPRALACLPHIPSAREPNLAAESAGVLGQRPYFVGAGRCECLVLIVVRPDPAASLLEEGAVLEGVTNGGPVPILPPVRHPSGHLK